MATQAIRFKAEPAKTLTLDVFTLASDTAEQSGLTCTEATNRKGLYTTANFTDTLDGRHYIVIKESGTAIGSEMVTLSNASATYDADSVSPASAVVSVMKSDTAFGKTGLLKHAAAAAIPSGRGTGFSLAGRSTLLTYGDSITQGQGATVASWATLVATAQGMTNSNQAVGGIGVWNQAASANTTLPVISLPAVTWMTGLNDIRRSTNQAKTRRKIEACVYSFLLAAYSNTVTAGSAMTRTGTWYDYGATSVGGRALGSYADTVGGNILTYTFTGTSFGVGFIGNSGDVEAFGGGVVRVDGIEVDRINLKAWYDNISDGTYDNRRGPVGRIYAGFANTEHTVEFENTQTGIFPVDFACTLKEPHLCAPVLICDIPYLSAVGYPLDPGNGSDEAIDAANQVQREIAAYVASLGFPVGVADTNKYYDLSTGVSVDNIHPNDTGHAQIARAINEAIKYTYGSEVPNLTLGLRQKIKKSDIDTFNADATQTTARANAATAAAQATTAATQSTTAATQSTTAATQSTTAATQATTAATQATTAATQSTTAATQATAAAASAAVAPASTVAALKADADFGTAGLLLDAKRARQFDSNRRTHETLGATQVRYTVYEDDGTTVAYVVDFNPLTGAKAVVS